MTPAQAKKVFGIEEAAVTIYSVFGAKEWAWRASWMIREKVTVHFHYEEHFTGTVKARRHAREFFKKLGLKVRFGK